MISTIFALCSAYGKSGVAVFRLSGNECWKVIRDITSKNFQDVLPRSMYLCKILEYQSNKLIDKGLIVYFQKDSSFTGEDSLEIHVHGSVAVIKMLNKTLSAIPYLRLAEPGEFSKRAFLNQKLDLTSIEGLADLIDAETELQHSQAIKQYEGTLEKLYNSWRQLLIQIIARLEAYIDFPDEDIPQEITTEIKNLIFNLMEQITNHIKDDRKGERLRNGIKLAIIGKPNVGKSSMINYLLSRDVAIVSNIPGTTRDIIEGHVDLGGFPLIVQDTAGIRENTNDQIEEYGINKAKEAAKEADIKLFMIDALHVDEDIDFLRNLFDENSVIIVNKSDLLTSDLKKRYLKLCPSGTIFISILKETNLLSVTKTVTAIARHLVPSNNTTAITRMRYRDQLEKVLSILCQCNFDDDIVLLAEELRQAGWLIGNLTGKINLDEILDEIFVNFCIGK